MLNDSYIIADHIRAACFIIADGVKPSGKQRGYVLRRLIRRALAASLRMNIDIENESYLKELVDSAISIYGEAYPELSENSDFIKTLLIAESQKYSKALKRGEKEWVKILAKLQKLEAKNEKDYLAETAWDLYQTHGVPIEASESILENANKTLNTEKLNNLIEDHQKLSQEKSGGQFKSGLGEDTTKTRSLHTVTHILHQILRDNFGQDLHQMGSAITDKKARFDFTIERKIEPEELEKISREVQTVIDKNLIMNKTEMSPDKAKELGAIGLFGEKYGDIVSVYTLADESGKVYSREFCGGPHVKSSLEIGKFKILKQKSVGQGVRRLEFDVE